MKIRTFFNIVLSLLTVGTVASLASLFSPLILDLNYLSSAGQIASAIAAIFGMAIACLALWIYINRESTEQKVADHTYEAKERLEEAVLQASILIKLSAEINGGKLNGTDDRLIKHALIVLKEALSEARKSPLYSALVSVSEKQNVADHLLSLEAHVTADLNENVKGVSNTVFISIPILWKSLIKIDAENIRQHSSAMISNHHSIDFLEKVGDHIMGNK